MDSQEIFRRRRTVRLYQQKPVSDEMLSALIDAARLAPCAANLQRLRFVVARSPELVSQLLPLTRWAKLVAPTRTPVKGLTGPAAFIAVTAPEGCGAIIHADAGAAIASMQLAGAAMGLGTCWLASVERPEAKAVLNLGDDVELLYLVSCGWPAESPVLDDNASETAYYLDEAGVLHVRKLPLTAVSSWV